MQKVFFHYADRTLSVKGKTKIKEAVLSIFKEEKVALHRIDYIFCSDEYLLEINREFLNHDYYTDIVSFELSKKDEPAEGDIYISIDRIRDNALSLGEPLYKELHRVIFHGALHLCGYKDKTRSQSLEMRNKEEEYLSLYFK